MDSTQVPSKSKKERIFEIIQIEGGSDMPSRIFDRLIIVLILISIAITTAQTFPLPKAAAQILDILDAVCMIAFTVEYLLRLWTADLLYPSGHLPWFRFIISPSAVIDLFSILPFYLSGLVPAGMVVFRLIRVARILRLFRINRYLDPVSTILTVLRQKASMIFASWFLVFVLMFASSLLLYYAEHDAQPSVFENAFSGLWWAVSTLSTTGYGDIYPVTALGKTLAIVITLLGMCIVAIPTGILTAGFMEAARYTDPNVRVSPNASGTGGILDISTRKTCVQAPFLINPDESSIEQLPLSVFFGQCIVETVSGEVSAEKIGAVISKASGDASRRILLRGDAVLSIEAAQFLKEIGILLFGISKSRLPGGNDILHTLLSGHIVLLTGLDLDSIDDGEYLLQAAPVLTSDASTAPCRAFLAAGN